MGSGSAVRRPAPTTFLGIDIGLTSTKAVVVSEDGQVLGSARREVAKLTAPGGHCERDLREQWDAVCAVTRSALAAAGIADAPANGAPTAVAVCGHGDGLILADEQGQPVRPGILSLDTRCQSLLAAMERDGRLQDFESETHRGTVPGRAVPLLLWLRTHEPEAIRAARWVLFAKDFVKLRLTGTVTTDYSDAGAGLLRRDRPEYATAVIDRLGLGDIVNLLPPLVPSAGTAGVVTPEAAAATGLPAGIPVASGGHDVSSAVLGTGVLAPPEVCVVSGTWSIDAIPTTVTSLSPTDADRGVHLRWFVDGTSVLALSSSPSGADLLAGLSAPLGTTGIGPLLTEMLGDPAWADRQRDDLLTIIPSLHGLARAVRDGATILGYRADRSGPDLLHATVEATAFRHRLGIELLSGLAGPADGEPAVVRLAGGGLAVNDAWVQLLADVLKRPVQRDALTAAGAIGAAAMAGVAAGHWPSLRAAIASVVVPGQVFVPGRGPGLEDRYQHYRSAVEALIIPDPNSSHAARSACPAAEGAE
jgi:L-xylulokinase